jgi:hypothetical protein
MCFYPQTVAFYSFAALVEACIAWFMYDFYSKAMAANWRESSEDSRTMYTDAAKTMISAAGIAAALLASLSTHQNNSLAPLVAKSIKTATISLVVCVCVSMALILTLARGHEEAKGLEQLKHPGTKVTSGPLSDFYLRTTLAFAFVALSCFFVGFLFLARIVWHL